MSSDQHAEEHEHPTGKPAAMRSRVENRFWEKVDHGDPDECWEWTGAVDRHGYGQFRLNGTQRAHRVAVMLNNDDIYCLEDIPGEDVRHSCDNPECCNPRHLKPGTHRENMVEASERSFDTQLSADDVRDIRERAADGEAHKDIAEDYGLYRTSISRTVRGEHYAWVD